MVKRMEINGMEQQLDAALRTRVTATDQEARSTDNSNLKGTLSEMFDRYPTWGVHKNETLAQLMKACAKCITSYPQLIDLARKWDVKGSFYMVMDRLFSQGLLSHIDHEEMRAWTRRLDEIFETLTQEEYIPHEDDGKRDTHMLLFYLNAYAKVAVSDASPEEKQEMYALLGDSDKRATLSIVVAIYYANPRLCGGYTHFSAVAGSFILSRREHYASVFLTAERFARHERDASFNWQSSKQHFYNKMVDWSKEKSQRDELTALLSVIFPKVEDWDPRNNSFHLIRGKKRPAPGLSEEVKNYVDGRHEEAIEHANRRGESIEKEMKNLDTKVGDMGRQLNSELALNRLEHMALSEKIGKAKGSTTINVEKIHQTNNYNGPIGQNINSANLVKTEGLGRKDN